MLKGLYTAYTGMINEQNRMDTLSNNLANSATVGFKKEGSTSEAFSDILAYKIKDTSEAPNIARRLGVNNPGVKIGENYTNYSQGSFRQTDNKYDFAINGEGFFTVEVTNRADEISTKYTRDGNFTLTRDGFLVTKDGDRVLGNSGGGALAPIQLDPSKESVIDDFGIIYQNDEEVARLQISDFADYNYLEHYGNNYYEPVEGAEFQDFNGSVHSGYLEASNVQVVSEMVEMINVTRAYESNQKIIQTYDETLQIAVSQLGKI